ncbi:hypothetical protein LCGC14_1390230 [marine sediment metagenome]|uniref:Uncharacterized protein n=1 Tax=marine sediment metagenome TaxID=412755 RepID=A0A0F9MFS7_9ZZZZ
MSEKIKKLYPFIIDAPTTVNKTQSLLLPLDKSRGKSFRINRLFIEVPALDVIAAADTIRIMLSTIEHKEQTSLLTSGTKNGLIMKESIDFHLAEVALTSLVDFNFGLVELKNFREIFLDVSVKNYITHLISGQDGAIACNVVIEGNYTGADKDDYEFNTF